MLYSQLGDGTATNPYRGTFTGNIVWDPSSGAPDPSNNDIPTIYATNVTIGSSSSLTILPGGILSFFGGISYNLTVNSGSNVTINPGASVTVNQIINNGNLLTLESNAYELASASLILNGYSGSASTEVQLYLPGGPVAGGGYTWHYVSVPISNIVAIAFNNYAAFPIFNLAQYVEPLATANNMAGWVAYDGYQYSSGNTLGYTFSTLTLGQGYNFYSAASPIVQLYANVSGGRLINVSNINYPVTCNSGSPDTRGWNLIGNPFTSCFSWDYTVSHNFLDNIDNAIYFTLNNTVASYISGIGANGGTGIIPPLQGFFVHATGASSVPLYTTARMHDLYQLRYKKGTGDYGKSADTISYVRLNFENQQDKNDLVVRFNNKATASFDKFFDAYKLNKTNGVLSAWTKTGNIDYSINGLPFPETSLEIPVGINVTTAGIYKLSLSELSKLDNYSVTLKDLLTNITVDLKKGGIMVFNTPAGMTEDRFVLTFTNITTGISDIFLPDNKFSIYSSAGAINILSLTEEFNNIPGSVNVYDLNGRRLFQQSNIEWQEKGELKQIQFNSAKQGLYIVEIKAGNKKYVEKVSLRK